VKITDTVKVAALLLFSVFCYAQVTQIEPQQLLKRIQNEQPLIIFDVRSEGEYAQGHIKGAINIPYDQIGNQKNTIDIYRDQKVVLYCHSGRRAGIAAGMLQKQGFTKLIDLNGHMILWDKLQYPLVK